MALNPGTRWTVRSVSVVGGNCPEFLVGVAKTTAGTEYLRFAPRGASRSGKSSRYPTLSIEENLLSDVAVFT